MTQIPARLIARELAARGKEVDPSRLGVVVCFLPPEDAATCRSLVAESLRAEDIELIMWRSVPCDLSVLGDYARDVLPIIEQAIVTAQVTGDELERALFLARKRMEREAPAGFAAPSASSRVVVYKGLFTASRIADFYWDLRDPDYETAFGLFHQRFSTNTHSSWDNAQPFRVLAHNGEINTIQANRSWMKAREKGATPGVWGERLPDVFPFLQPGLSDSASLDNVFELLMRSGRSLPHVMEMLIPAAWENAGDLSPELEAFYAYHAFLTEPWDGPAAIAACDGISCWPAWIATASARPAGRSPRTCSSSPPRRASARRSQGDRHRATRPGRSDPLDGRTGEIRHSDDVKQALPPSSRTTSG